MLLVIFRFVFERSILISFLIKEFYEKHGLKTMNRSSKGLVSSLADINSKL